MGKDVGPVIFIRIDEIVIHVIVSNALEKGYDYFLNLLSNVSLRKTVSFIK